MKSLLLIAPFILVGCAPAYIQPESGPVAKLKFATNIKVNQWIYPGDTCKGVQAHVVVDKNQITVPEEINIPAGKRLIYAHGMGTSVMCVLHTSFIPEAGATYVSEYALNNMWCNARLYRIQPGSNEKVIEQTARREDCE